MKNFTYPRQFDPGTALYDVDNMITLPPIPVSVIPVERAPMNVGDVELLKIEFTVSADNDVPPTTRKVLGPVGLNVTAPVAVQQHCRHCRVVYLLLLLTMVR